MLAHNLISFHRPRISLYSLSKSRWLKPINELNICARHNCILTYTSLVSVLCCQELNFSRYLFCKCSSGNNRKINKNPKKKLFLLASVTILYLFVHFSHSFLFFAICLLDTHFSILFLHCAKETEQLRRLLACDISSFFFVSSTPLLAFSHLLVFLCFSFWIFASSVSFYCYYPLHPSQSSMFPVLFSRVTFSLGKNDCRCTGNWLLNLIFMNGMARAIVTNGYRWWQQRRPTTLTLAHTKTELGTMCVCLCSFCLFCRVFARSIAIENVKCG